MALGVMGLVACDAAAPSKNAVSQPIESQAPAAGETLTDVVGAALADILRDRDAFSRARRLGALLPTAGPESVPAVEQLLADQSLDFGATELELLLRYWATYQPEAAARWALDKSSPLYRHAALFSALTVWAERDPQAAVAAAWPWRVERPGLGGTITIALVRGWYAAGDPPELRQFLHDLGMGFPRQRAIAAYLRSVIQTQGIEAVRRWAESLPDDEEDPFKLVVFRQLAVALPMFDHEASLRWCEAHCDGPYGINLRSILARDWVLKDGAAALDWLSKAPEDHETDIAVRLTFDLWGRTDREAALAWMASQTTGEPAAWLRPIFPAYAELLAPDRPAEAIRWAERIESDEDREIVLSNVVSAWRQVDEAAAEAWLVESPLSEAAKARARTPRRKLPNR
ncbi:MAG: hypothetical protein JRG80_05800 [Deltaproteobacteria bacterium]|nr:hypothetical protein [Deltaproteobacteria bacterium]